MVLFFFLIFPLICSSLPKSTTSANKVPWQGGAAAHNTNTEHEVNIAFISFALWFIQFYYVFLCVLCGYVVYFYLPIHDKVAARE